MFDVFVATLRCPRCGTISPPKANTAMQTHIRGASADGSELAVGYSFDAVDLTTKHLVGAGYRIVRLPSAIGTMGLLDVWTCPACETEQWAMVEIVEGRIDRIEAVSIDRGTLEAANFISDTNAELLAAALMDVPPWELSERNLDSVDVLRQRLSAPAGDAPIRAS